MSFISYAQNLEDVLLWRALGHIKHGFYIDVGANDPVDHSVTKAFYDAGWSGINIEPLPAFHQQFEQQRPRDINLAIAAGASDGSLTLFDVPSVNGWASPDRAVADAHRAGGFEVAELTVPVRTLAGVCANYVKGDIHFLKVDVEGFEGEVLRGMDFERWRPWVLVIEATMPNSRVTNHETWEALVTSRRYRYAHFDGLNRYYVAEEHAELAQVLSIQPNVFDDYITRHLDEAWRATARAESAIVLAEDRVARADANRWEAEKRGDREYQRAQDALAHSAALQQHIEHVAAEHARAEAWGRDLEQRLLATLASTSWRVTRPLRMAGTLVHRMRAVPYKARAAALARRILTRLTRNERVRRLFIPLLLRFPEQATKVSRTLNAIKQGPGHAPTLPASARKVLADLQRARRNPEVK
ncbi:FkbM family methyltransferase [Massilia sp. GCM10020059]|uniref:FkbM family methyltransferase n=1 Tax=Massilia agrisoli TaxID=2892444 RepID=A0ABS8IY70_9BURK|nr:FkbM family methyltransferase [Massilia agrisoli]MCC6073461.1 FkbM family methyltransferase [Massilia agrisoli]